MSKKRALLVWLINWLYTCAPVQCVWFSVCRCSVGWVEIDWLCKLALAFQSQISKSGERRASYDGRKRKCESCVFLKISKLILYWSNQSCHEKLTMIWWHFHSGAADASVITPEQTIILALYWFDTAVLFNPVCGKSLQGKWVAKMDVLTCVVTDKQKTVRSCFFYHAIKLSFMFRSNVNTFSLDMIWCYIWGWFSYFFF